MSHPTCPCGNPTRTERAKLCSACALEHRREADRRWRTANPDKSHASQRRWREANRERNTERMRRWRRNNRARARAKAAAWRKANPQSNRNVAARAYRRKVARRRVIQFLAATNPTA